MMNAKTTVQEALKAGVYLYLDQGQLAFKARKGQFTEELKRKIKNDKERIIAYLAEQELLKKHEVKKRGLDEYPLSYSQRRLHFLNRLEAGSAHYNLRVALKLDGVLDECAMTKAFDTLVERHQILRSTYHINDSGVVQRVNSAIKLVIEKLDLTLIEGRKQEQHLQNLLLEEGRRHFDLERDLMMHARLVTLGENSHVVMLTLHHIATDGTSMTILTREFIHLYDAYKQSGYHSLPELPFQFGDFAAWQHGDSGKALIEKQLEFWMKNLSGVPALHQLPLDKPRPLRPDYQGRIHTQIIDGLLVSGLEMLANRHRCTMFVVIKALFTVLLSKFSGSDDIVIGAPATGRNQQGTQALVGFFANTLVFRHRLASGLTIDELLSRQAKETLDVLSHQDVPFELLVDELHLPRDLSYNPLIQIFLAFQNYERETLNLGGLTIEPIQPEVSTIRFDLELTVHPDKTGNGLYINWGYATALFETTTIRRMAVCFEKLISDAIEDSQTPVSQLSMVSKTEKEKMDGWNSTRMEYDTRTPLHEIIERQARITPEAVALKDAKATLTYAELMSRVNEAVALLKESDINSGDLVGLFLPRSVDIVVGILAILKSGAAYVPLDPKYPPERLAYMVKDSGMDSIITISELAGSAPKQVKTILLDKGAPGKSAIPLEPVNPEQLAYVIYTSGSTGQPKGVMVAHEQLNHFCFAIKNRLDLTRGVWLAVSAYSFDISILELLCPLSLGFEVVIGDHQQYSDREHNFARLIEENAVTHLQCTPSLLHLYMELPEFCKALAKIEMIMVGGDSCPMTLVGNLKRYTNARIINMYGPTEATIWSSTSDLSQCCEPICIGKPIANIQYYVVDNNLKPVPIGVCGELLISGHGLSKGYFGQPELTAEKFIELELDEGIRKRVYRTGDLVRWIDRGEVEFLGRLDYQVKVNGYRIELGEIESVISAIPCIEGAVAICREKSADEKLIVVYLVGSSKDLSKKDLLDAVKIEVVKKLPVHMLPSSYEVLESFPLTPNGKVDRKALQSVDYNPKVEFVEPATTTEKMVASIWKELLGVEKVGCGDSFFAIGGHSLSAIRLMTKINEKYECNIQLQDLFEFQTLEEMSIRIEQLCIEYSGGKRACEDYISEEYDEVEL